MEKHFPNTYNPGETDANLGMSLPSLKECNGASSSVIVGESPPSTSTVGSRSFSGGNPTVYEPTSQVRDSRYPSLGYIGAGRKSIEDMSHQLYGVEALDTSTVTDILLREKMATWYGIILRYPIQKAVGTPHLKDFVFLKFLSSVQSVFLTSEINDDGIFHVHGLIKSISRSDKIRDRILSTRPDIDVCKLSKVKYFPSLFKYILKNPIAVVSTDIWHLNAAHALLIESHKNKPPGTNPSTNKKKAAEDEIDSFKDSKFMAPIARTIIGLMRRTKATTPEELMKKAPNEMAPYLHRTNLGAVVDNCRLWLSRPTCIDSLTERFKEHSPDPVAVHRYLAFQSVNVGYFDEAMYSWLLERKSKRNCLVIQGPSNSGKSTFIRPLLSIFLSAEIQNGTNFQFQNCPNKELLLWEEPLIAPDQADKCKLVFEGVETQIDIKFKEPKTLYRTPVLITSNRPIWHYCSGEQQPFENRCFLFFFERTISGDGETVNDDDLKCPCAFCAEDIENNDVMRPPAAKKMAGALKELTVQDWKHYLSYLILTLKD